jgi:hypothetical protein
MKNKKEKLTENASFKHSLFATIVFPFIFQRYDIAEVIRPENWIFARVHFPSFGRHLLPRTLDSS